KEQLQKIVDVQLEQLRQRLSDRGLKLDVTEQAKALLADEGYDPTFGARPLKRVIQQRIENPLASLILKGEFGDGDTIRVDAVPSRRDFTFTRTAEVVEGELVEDSAK